MPPEMLDQAVREGQVELLTAEQRVRAESVALDSGDT
jgi:hypothetical protein